MIARVIAVTTGAIFSAMSKTHPRVVRALQSLAVEAPIKLRVVGDCMAPLAVSGAPVWVSHRKHYWPGDVLAFRAADGSLLLHRLIGFRPRAAALDLVTQGDSCSRHDVPVRIEDVIGKVSGGDCARELTHVPVTHRLKALFRFASVVLRKFSK